MNTNKELVFNYIKNNDKTINATIEFLDKNGIDYAFFENVEELFDYYDESDYKSFSNNIIDIIFKTGELIKIL